jgi:uncharacterized protein (DUF1501 family)
MTTENSRRLFLKNAGALSMAGVAGPFAMNLAAFGQVAAQDANDYKALVCLFLLGGNDHANTLVPYDPVSYATYRAERPALATPWGALSPTLLNPKQALPGGRQYALAPQLAPLLAPFNDGKLAVMLNIGTLTEPLDKAQYKNFPSKRPSKLFSHNDQQATYQAAGSVRNSSGWGGRLGDGFAQNTANATFTCINVGSGGVFNSGAPTLGYQVSATGGAVGIKAIKEPLFGSVQCRDEMKRLITAPSAHLLEDHYTRIVARSIKYEELLSPALRDALPSGNFTAGEPLSDQLSMVARIISKQAQLLPGTTGRPKRQVFFVTLGGFDTHSALAEEHPKLLTAVGNAMAAFHDEMARQQIGKQVTLFTASDFGRTLNSDGDGSDHGWGSMHFVLGGAVEGGYYGQAPKMGSKAEADDGENDVGRGRLLPRMAVDQFAGQLATWFGVPAADLNTVLPNLKNFAADTLPLGFMKV